MDDTLIETIRVGDSSLEIHHDPFPEDPRDWGNLGVMVCGHRRYTLGDKHAYDLEAIGSWQAVEATVLADHPGALILPLYLYDHSGITISTDPERFRAWDSAAWDWGQVGLIYATREDLLREWSAKRLTRPLREQAEDVLRQEVATYDEYLTGQCHSYLVKGLDGNTLDSCSGFYGGIEYVRDQGRRAAEELRTPPLPIQA